MAFFMPKQCVCKRAVLKGRCLKCPAARFLFGGISIRTKFPKFGALDICCAVVDPLFQLLGGALLSVISISRTFSHSAFSQSNKL